MKILKGFKYRLYPTKFQHNALKQHAGNTRFIWNHFLAENIKYYEKHKKFNFSHAMITSIPKLKEEHDFLKLSFSQSLQTVGRHLNDAIVRYLKGLKTGEDVGFPVFKKKSKQKDSFHCPQKWYVCKGFVKIPKIGKVKWVKHRNFQGKPKSITITQDGDQWYCSVLCESNIKEQEFKQDNLVGIDVGLKDFAILSDGNKIKRQRFTKRYENKLRKEQRSLSKKVKGSNNRQKQKKVVQAVHRKIRNSRKDFLHKATHYITTKYDGVCLESLNVEGMMKNHKLSKSIADASWSEFKRQLRYKCSWKFKHISEIDQWFPSSKLCSIEGCGYINKNLNIKDRFWDCICGAHHDRDINAATNILREGIKILLDREKFMLVEEQYHVPMKQEKET